MANGLPMPWRGARTFGRREWDEYRERRSRHAAANPDYGAGRHLPTSTAADRMFDLVAWERGRRLADLIPNWKWLREDEREELKAVEKQALLVALDAAVMAGERGWVLTTNRVADALCARWSDN